MQTDAVHSLGLTEIDSHAAQILRLTEDKPENNARETDKFKDKDTDKEDKEEENDGDKENDEDKDKVQMRKIYVHIKIFSRI